MQASRHRCVRSPVWRGWPGCDGSYGAFPSCLLVPLLSRAMGNMSEEQLLGARCG